MNEWMNEWMNEMNEWMNEWMNKWMNECSHTCSHTWSWICSWTCSCSQTSYANCWFSGMSTRLVSGGVPQSLGAAGAAIPVWQRRSGGTGGGVRDRRMGESRVRTPEDRKHLYNICTPSAQRLRRWSNIVHMLYKCFVFAGPPVLITPPPPPAPCGPYWSAGATSLSRHV